MSNMLQLTFTSELLSIEEERSLLFNYRVSRDSKSLDRLIYAHLKLISKIAHKKCSGSGVLTPDDLISEGVMGMMHAIDKFNPKRNNRLVSYAMHWISSYMARALLENSAALSMSLSKKNKQMFFALKKGHATTNDFDVNEVVLLNKMLPECDIQTLRSFCSRLKYGEAHETTTSNGQDMIEKHIKQADVSHVRNSLKLIPQRDREILELRIVRCKKLKHIAEIYNITQERVRQIVLAALKRLHAVHSVR